MNALDNRWAVLTSGNQDGSIINHDLTSKHTYINTFDYHTKGVLTVKWSDDLKYLASSSHDKQVCIWSKGYSKKPFNVLKGH